MLAKRVKLIIQHHRRRPFDEGDRPWLADQGCSVVQCRAQSAECTAENLRARFVLVFLGCLGSSA